MGEEGGDVGEAGEGEQEQGGEVVGEEVEFRGAVLGRGDGGGGL